MPVAVGFGISTPEQAIKMANISDGAIVGSAIVKIIGEMATTALSPLQIMLKLWLKQWLHVVSKLSQYK